MGGHTYNNDPAAWKKDTQKFCGLEAKVTDPSTGKTSLLYIGDAFDDHWVRVSPFAASHFSGSMLTNVIIAGKGLHRYHDRRLLEPPRQSEWRQKQGH
jgi:hypothetical protein